MEDSKLEADAWDWHDDSFTLEYHKSRGLSPSLWEEFPEDNKNTSSIFASTPVTDIMEHDSVLLPDHELIDEEDAFVKSTLSAKRRRVLTRSCGNEDACSSDSICELADDFIYPPKFCRKNHAYWNDFDMSNYPASQFPDAMNYIDAVSVPCSIVRRNLALDQAKWEAIWPDESVQLDHSWKEIRNVEEPSREHYASDKRTGMGPCRSHSSVAYPFALVKPSEVEGNVTIHHLNQRISKPQALRESKFNISDESPKLPTSDQRLGLSGKSIVSLTKIHTEGKGTITIMRTKE